MFASELLDVLLPFKLIVTPRRVTVFSGWNPALCIPVLLHQSPFSILCFCPRPQVGFPKIDKLASFVQVQSGLCICCKHVNGFFFCFWLQCTEWCHLHTCLWSHTWWPVEDRSKRGWTSMAPKWTLVQPQILVFANMKWPVQHILFGAFHIDPEPLLCICLLTKLNYIFFRSSSCCTAWLHKLQK